MFEKLEAVEKRYEELTKEISDPEVIANQARWQKAMKEHASIEEIFLFFCGRIAKFLEKCLFFIYPLRKVVFAFVCETCN